MDLNNFNPQMGMDVIGSDGEKVGEIDAVEQDHIVVRKGFFFPSDHYIPFSAISSADDRGVYLHVTKDDALNQQWDTAPTAATGTAYGDEVYTEGDAGYVANADADTAYVDNVTNADRGEYVEEVDRGAYAADVDRRDNAGNVYNDDHNTIEVAEEELTATKREVDRGSVGIEKHVVEEQQTIDVPVHEEHVDVTRRSVDRPVDGDHVFQDERIDVPVHGEEVDVEKRARVVEEIDIDKTVSDRVEQVTDTVRREEVHVDEHGRTLDRDGRYVDADGNYVDGDDDRSLMDKAKDAMDTDNDGKIGR